MNKDPNASLPEAVAAPASAPPPLPAPEPASETPPSSPDAAPLGKEGKGCAVALAFIVCGVILLFWWREILLCGSFVGIAALIAYLGIRAKKSKPLSIAGGVVAGLVCAVILDATVPGGGISKADLKNPPVAIEKLAKEALSSERGVSSVKVEKGGGENEGKYFVNIDFHTQFLMDEEGTLRNIHLAMHKAYTEILKHPELPICYIKIAAQLETKDRFGNEHGLSDVYRTQLTMKELEKLNRKNLDAVYFPDIWEEVFVHPMFFPYVSK